jgi:hypothetical protein
VGRKVLGGSSPLARTVSEDERIDEARERELEARDALRKAEAEAREHLEEDERLEEEAPELPKPPADAD